MSSLQPESLSNSSGSNDSLSSEASFSFANQPSEAKLVELEGRLHSAGVDVDRIRAHLAADGLLATANREAFNLINSYFSLGRFYDDGQPRSLIEVSPLPSLDGELAKVRVQTISAVSLIDADQVGEFLRAFIEQHVERSSPPKRGTELVHIAFELKAEEAQKMGAEVARNYLEQAQPVLAALDSLNEDYLATVALLSPYPHQLLGKVFEAGVVLEPNPVHPLISQILEGGFEMLPVKEVFNPLELEIGDTVVIDNCGLGEERLSVTGITQTRVPTEDGACESLVDFIVETESEGLDSLFADVDGNVSARLQYFRNSQGEIEVFLFKTQYEAPFDPDYIEMIHTTEGIVPLYGEGGKLLGQFRRIVPAGKSYLASFSYYQGEIGQGAMLAENYAAPLLFATWDFEPINATDSTYAIVELDILNQRFQIDLGYKLESAQIVKAWGAQS